MDETERIVLAVAIATGVFFALLITLITLMMVNTSRRLRYQAEMSALQRKQDQAVLEAERETTRHTLREIGRELHDNVGQLLSVAQLGLNTAMEEEPGLARLAAARDALDHGVDEVRRLGHDLNTDLWQHRTLADAISAEAERIERVSRVKAHLLVAGDLPHLPPDTSTVLFRVFQLIITNALRHSRAGRIEITVEAGPGLVITVADNGVGFDTATTARHAGILTIHKRCAIIGYQAVCTSSPGNGCTWRLNPTPSHGT